MLKKLILTVVVLTSPVFAELKLPALISDNMVLQQQANVRIYGHADPNEKVTVTFRDQKQTTLADDKGFWQVMLKPMTAGGPFEMTINNIKLKNIMVGEVWLASGQSNMDVRVPKAKDPSIEIANANYPQIRMFTVKTAISDLPALDVKGKWLVCNPENVPDFSATGYYFSRHLHKKLNVPVGILNSSLGGTFIECWLSKDVLLSDPQFKYKVLEKKLLPGTKDKNKFMEKVWAEIQKNIKPANPFCFYNGMIAPIVQYTIRGAIWYQGESNTENPYEYRRLFPLLIHTWRKMWNQGDFPFLFVQLANYNNTNPCKTAPTGNWALLREAQSMALAIPNTAMATTIDVGDPEDLHPKNKQEIARRLGLAAEALVYGKDVAYSGPIYSSMSVQKNKILIKFTHCYSGLSTKNQSPKGFTIAGADKKFFPAQAKLDRDSVLVWSQQVAKPIAVRYGWADNPQCNLYNSAGLPASPFRSDDWPGVTANVKMK